ncbi:probable protein arginine N-methyltransferase 6 [Gastrolobium bilobum]|uniref:probable protein arginine N-methyltransferase 6 n=1 Tax=Gastrolobium bilobum TaxID=150636 RepID=UPI002AAFEB0B|nr:probable protein arginine N-methyltransferase 6 [Gastrolobium bilobum]
MQNPGEQGKAPLRITDMEQPPRRMRRSRGFLAGFRNPEPQQYHHQRQRQQQVNELQTRVTQLMDFDKAYFDQYAHLSVHEEMLKDRVRTEAYKAAIMHHQAFISGKVVLDVGCGTGILSIFCAQAGAKRVYAVEASNIALQARRVVEANNLSNVVIVLHGRVEDLELSEKVDVIISEWMGYMLLYESMLGSVITARNRWLKRGGLILPSIARLYMAPFTHPSRYSESIDFWRNVYGIDMSAMMPLAKQCAFEGPSVETITCENVLTWPLLVKYINCYYITIPELESITESFKFKSMMQAPLHGFAFWFDVEFTGPILSPMPINFQFSSTYVDNHPVDDNQRKRRTNPNEELRLSTSPEDPPTHWHQTLIYLYDPIELKQDQLIEGSVTLSHSQKDGRFMNIHLEYTSGGRSYVKETVMR